MPYRTVASGGTCGHDEPRQNSTEIGCGCQSHCMRFASMTSPITESNHRH